MAAPLAPALDPVDNNVLYVICRILTESGPFYVTGLQPRMDPDGHVRLNLQVLSLEQHSWLALWHFYDAIIPEASLFIYGRLNGPTRANLRMMYHEDFYPLHGYTTDLALCLLVGLYAYCELVLCPLRLLLRDRTNGPNSLEVIFARDDGGYVLMPAAMDRRSVDGGVIVFDELPFFYRMNQAMGPPHGF